MAHDLIVFGEDWGGHPSSTQHLIQQFLGHRRVIWVNSLGLRAPRLTLKDGARLLRKFGDLATRSLSAELPVRRDESRFPDAVIAPAALPMPGSPAAAQLTRAFVSRQVKAAMATLGMRKPIVWTSLPTAEPLLGAFDEHAVVYYAGDDFGALEGVDHRPVLELERRLASRAALVLTASARIAERFEAGKTLVVPHGVDVELFSRPRERPADLPASGPIVGFYGNLSGWIDIELIRSAALALPEVQFVLVGPVHTDTRALAGLPNLRLLGPKPHAELPAYAQHFDVAILPFRDTPQIRACNPLKLREYLASGAAVASTELPALEPYRALLHVGNGPAFVEAIRAALEDHGRAGLRRRAVANETWARRAEDIASVIDLL